MKSHSKIFIAGHDCLAGSALVTKLRQNGYGNLLLRSHKQMEALNGAQISLLFASQAPDYVVVTTYTKNDRFDVDSLIRQINVFQAACDHRSKRLLFLNSSELYPAHGTISRKEEALTYGDIRQSHCHPGLRAGIEICLAYNRHYNTHFLATLLPDLYGPGEACSNPDAGYIARIINEIHRAKLQNQNRLYLNSDGTSYRNILFSMDLADACIHLMNLDDEKFSSLLTNAALPVVNIGPYRQHSVAELANCIARVVGYRGEICFSQVTDQLPSAHLDCSRLQNLGWQTTTTITDGIQRSYHAFLGDTIAGDKRHNFVT